MSCRRYRPAEQLCRVFGFSRFCGTYVATLTAVNAVATVAANPTEVLFDAVRNSGALLEPSAKGVDAAAAAILSVLEPANANSIGGVDKAAVVDKAAGLILDVANAAGALQDGVRLGNAALAASANATESGASVNNQLQAATSAICDAVIDGARVGILVS